MKRQGELTKFLNWTWTTGEYLWLGCAAVVMCGMALAVLGVVLTIILGFCGIRL